ncbi:MAG TPA: hypothetical protein VEK76_09905 [Candidatus Binatia bacterium]|nr:hypothetical protein [Candidatus Binatia bacterium]
MTGLDPEPGSAPAPILAAIQLMAGDDPGRAERGFEMVIAAEPSPTWRAVALLGQGLCQELRAAPEAAAASVRAAIESWAAADPGSCAVALAALGRALADGSDSGPAAALLSAARRLSAGPGAAGLGGVLVELGAAAAERGDARAATALWERGRAEGDAPSRAAAAANLGRLAAARGEEIVALGLFDEALEVGEGPHLRVVADGLVALAAQAAEDRRWEDVGARLRQALPLRQADRDARGAAEVLHDLGIAHWRRGQLHAATRCLEDCRRSAEELADDSLRAAALRALARVALEGGRLVVALAYAREAAASSSAPEDRRVSAGVLRAVGDEARRAGAASLSAEAFRLAASLLADPDR